MLAFMLIKLSFNSKEFCARHLKILSVLHSEYFPLESILKYFLIFSIIMESYLCKVKYMLNICEIRKFFFDKTNYKYQLKK